MASDDIQRIIYKVELDDSGYISGVERMATSSQKLASIQEQSNQKLKANELELKNVSEVVENARKRLEQYTGTNEKYKKSLELNLKKAQDEQERLNNLVAESRKEYDAATKAAQDFANTSQKAANLQPTGGRIPTPTVAAPPPNIAPIIPPEAFKDFDLASILGNTVGEFDALRVAIGLAEERMKSLNAEDEEFKQLAPLVQQGKEALQQFDKATQSAAGSQGSIREQLRRGREELVRLEQAGQGATEQYFQLEKQVAKLTDEFGDQQQRIRILASDTKLLDFGKGAITAATSAFQAYTAVSILAGDESAELQKKTMQLFAAMQLLQSLEQLSNLTRREGILATLAQSAAQSTYTAVVGASTGALRVFRLALLGTGIGAVIIGIGLLVNKFKQIADAEKEVAKDQKLLNEIQGEAIKSYTSEVIKLDLVKQKLNDLNIPQKERIRLAKQYNETAETGNKIDLKSIDNIALLNSAIDRQIAKIRERALAKAAENVVTQKAEIFFNAQEKAREKAEATIANERAFAAQQGTAITPQQPTTTPLQPGQTIPIFNTKTKKFENRVLTQGDVDALKKESDDFHKQRVQQLEQNRVNREIENDKEVQDAKKELDRASNIAGQFIGIEDLITPQTGAKETKGIENIFIQERNKLLADLAALRTKEAESIKSINDQFAAKLIIEQNRIAGLLKAKKITPEQEKVLLKLAVDVNTTELNKALDDFNKKVTDARKKLNDELHDLQEKNTQDQLNLIQDEFQRRAAIIDFNEKKELENSKQNIQDRINALDLDPLIQDELDFENARAIIIQAGEEQALNITRKFANERQDLAIDIFEKSLKRYEDAVQLAISSIDEQSAIAIRAASNSFLQGITSYDQFEKEVQRIKREAAAKSRDIEIQNKNAELLALDLKLDTMLDHTSAAYQKLVEQRQKLKNDLDKLNAQDAIKDAEDKKTETKTDDRTQRIVQYTEAIGQFADSIIAFWQKANEAEQKSLDRSISIQEQRVNAAQRIAERGNAEYLKAEEDRLQQLQLARENAARRQLAIDAALQASQLLVGITGAISKIASGVGVAETIAEIAVIVAALATGYGLVKSLQGNQPRLKEGTPYLQREGHPKGVDTIPAWLTEGEAVIPQEKNKKYKKSVEAIYHGKVPAKVLNEFVENYVNKKSIFNKSTNEISNKKGHEENIIKKLVDEKTSKNIISSDVQNNLVNENISIKEVKKYSDIVNKIFDAETKKKSQVDFDKTIHQIINEFTDKKISLNEVKGLLKSENIEKKYDEVKKVAELVTNKIQNKAIHDEQYSQVINRVLEENRSLVENKKIDAITHKVLNSVSDKKISLSEVKSFINTKKEDLVKKKNTIDIVNKLLSEKTKNDFISTELKNSLVNEMTSLSDVQKYSNAVNNVVNVSTYKKFTDNIRRVPERVLDSFIQKHYSEKVSSDVLRNLIENYGKYERTNTTDERVNRFDQSTTSERANKSAESKTNKTISDFTKSISTEQLNRFIDTHHTVKPVPQPDYQRIKEVAETKISHDGKLASLISEQNKMLAENNELHKITHRALKSMGVSLNIDRNGISASVMQWMEEQRRALKT